MKLGEVIRKERELRGLSVYDLSRETAIPENIIKKIEDDPEYLNTPHGRLQLKALMRYLNIDLEKNFPDEHTLCKENLNQKKHLTNPKFKKYMLHIGMFLMLVVFIYANALYNSGNIDIKHVNNNTNQVQNIENGQNLPQVSSITLKSSGDVWITAVIDGEKTIFNIKEGETKTINFQNKIAFETIGNVNKLTIVFGDKEVSFKDKEVIHNVFIDEEGIFYNGYNVLRGKPKI